MSRQVRAPLQGFVAAIDALAIGLCVVALGGGRRRPGEAIDPRVGFTRLAGLGAEVGDGASFAPLGIVHARSEADADEAAAALQAAYRIGEAPPPLRAAVLETL